jgi:hypothetical protein
VYVEETSFRAPSIEGVGTTTTAFVGPTLTGPVATMPSALAVPQLLTSFGDFQNIYGGYDTLSIESSPVDPKNTNFMALAVKSFFDNGGSMLYVSRVYSATGAPPAGYASAGSGDVTVRARFPGAFANGQSVTVTLVATKIVSAGTLPPGSIVASVASDTTTTLYANGTGSTFNSLAATPTPMPATPAAGTTLYVLSLNVSSYGAASPKATSSGSVQTQSFSGLGLDPANASYLGSMLGATPPRHIDALENQIAFTIASTVTPATLITDLFGATAEAHPAAGASVTFTLANGTDGTEPLAGDYDAALALLEGLEDVAIVAAPGSSILTDNAAIVQSLITHVSRERAYRIAILDAPPGDIASDDENVRAHIDSSYAALYVPWVVVANPLARSGTSIPAEITVPPSGMIAGIYARNDEQNSVAKAPANEVLLGALDLERQITFGEQATLNPLGINCLRYFPNRGYRVWGARTATSDSEFMYVNVRRYLIYLEHSIDNSTQWAVFENNGPALWARVTDSVDSFLNAEFVEGRLLGTTPAQAYFVRCDRTTMTQNDLDNGRMICLIGVALLKPAEFVIFRIGQKTADARS